MFDRVRFETATAWRSLAATPAPTVAAILTLAVAVAVNLAMFGLVDRAIVSPPQHVTDPARVMTLGFRVGDPPNAGRMTSTSYPTYVAIRDHVPAFAHVGAYARTSLTAMVDGEQRNVNALMVTSSYFDVLGARPVWGTGLTSEADHAGGAPAVVLSHSWWHSAFGGDRAVVGRHVTIAGIDYVVAGVMPAGFTGHSAEAVDVWVPLAAAMADSPGWDSNAYRNVLSIVGRLASDQPAVAAETQAGAAISRVVSLTPIAGADVGGNERQIAWWLSGVSVLVLVIGLANTATLLVVRASKRRADAAIRAALGASRSRLVSQAVAEALVLATMATVLSLLLAPVADEMLRRVLFPGLVADAGLRASTLWTASAAGLLAACVASIANIWQLPARANAWEIAATARSGVRRTRMTTGLLLVQTTLSVLLLSGAGLFARSFYQLAAQDFGMRMDGVVIVDFEPSGAGGRGQAEQLLAALDHIRAMPQVEVATTISALPFGGHDVPPISVPGRAEPPSVDGQLPFLNPATPEFMKILGVDVVEGRTFTDADDHGAPVVIVNETMARSVWPGEQAVGKCIRIGFDSDFDPATAVGPPVPSSAVTCREVIGVARDVRQRSLVPTDHEGALMQYFVPFSQIPMPPFAPQNEPMVTGLMLRTRASADSLAAQIRRTVVGTRTDLPFVRVQPYVNFLDRQMRPWRLGTTLFLWFSALALAVAAVGLYATFTHAVAERRREMAIRIAIGAEPSRVMRLVLREALVLATVGAAMGCTAAVFAGRVIQSLLFGTSPSDPLVLSTAAATMLVVATLATILPARMAAASNPNELLRSS